MNKSMRVLTIQDVSCFGQCSTTVALPILSALGIETPILPTAILSTHTAGFNDFIFIDLKDELPKIQKHWEKEGITFDAVYTGYLGAKEDVEVALSIAKGNLNRGPLIVDPAFGDHGKLYPGFDHHYVEAMVSLIAASDVLLPNLTEAYALIGKPYNQNPSKDEINEILNDLVRLGAKAVVLKGIGNKENETGIVTYENGNIQSYSHPKISQDFHGTGDVFASVFTAAFLHQKGLLEAGKIACDFVYRCIENTIGEVSHSYGVIFEPLLGSLAKEF